MKHSLAYLDKQIMKAVLAKPFPYKKPHDDARDWAMETTIIVKYKNPSIALRRGQQNGVKSYL